MLRVRLVPAKHTGICQRTALRRELIRRDRRSILSANVVTSAAPFRGFGRFSQRGTTIKVHISIHSLLEPSDEW